MLNQDLNSKISELRSLEDDHLIKQRQIEDLQTEEVMSSKLRGQLADDLDRLMRENSDLVGRMGDICGKNSIEVQRLVNGDSDPQAIYEAYLSLMNKERDEMVNKNKSHMKLLSSKYMVLVLEKLKDSKLSTAFSSINGHSNHCGEKENALKGLCAAFNRYESNKKRDALRRWYVNLASKNHKLPTLVEFKADNKLKFRFFYTWRKAYLHKINATRKIRNFTKSHETSKLRRAFAKWKAKKDGQTMIEFTLKKLTSRKKNLDTRDAFLAWVYTKKRADEKRNYEILNGIVS